MSQTHERHRGAHPADAKLFAVDQLPRLQQAVAELSWLLSRNYALRASLKLVGDRYELKHRQRVALARAACADQQRAQRQERRLPFHEIARQDLLIDGFNALITVEAALAGGVLLHCRDGCIRDLSSVHGSYRSVAETEAALQLLSETLLAAQPRSALWLLDQPVSNSGRLAAQIRELAVQHNWPWQVEVVMNPDKVLRASSQIVVTSDSNILDGAQGWLNLNETLLERLPQAWLIELSDTL
jgi:hypothetical protein